MSSGKDDDLEQDPSSAHGTSAETPCDQNGNENGQFILIIMQKY